MKTYLAMLGAILLLCSGCTYSITQVNTEGTASDVVDETESVTPSTSVTVPLSAT
jgi:hypothetical protein